ncbi:MAG: hypothetical protein N2999_05655 [Proteobacteria bacterium]|nr:hypothetical protein [Pseudomonadota bacterium]
MKKIFSSIIVIFLFFLSFQKDSYAWEKVYKVSFPEERDIEKGLLIRYYKILACYHTISELKEEIDDFAFVAIEDVKYEGFDGKHIFSVYVNTESYNDKNSLLDDEIVEIFEIFLQEWKNLSDLQINSVTENIIRKYEKELALIDIIKGYSLYTKTGRAFVKQRINEIESKIATTLDINEPKTILLRTYISLKSGYGIKAEEILKSGAKMYPDNFIIQNRYGILLKEMGKFDEAIKEFQSQFDKFNNPLSLYYLGMTYKNNEDCKMAVENLNRFIKLTRNNNNKEKIVARNAINECEEGFRKKNYKNKKNIRRKR